MFDEKKIKNTITEIIIERINDTKKLVEENIGFNIDYNFDINEIIKKNNIDKITKIVSSYNDFLNNYNSNNIKFSYIKTPNPQQSIPAIVLNENFYFVLNKAKSFILIDISDTNNNIRIRFNNLCNPEEIEINPLLKDSGLKNETQNTLIKKIVNKINKIEKANNENFYIVEPIFDILNVLNFDDNSSMLMLLENKNIMSNDILEAIEILTIERDINLKEKFNSFQKKMTKNSIEMQENFTKIKNRILKEDERKKEMEHKIKELSGTFKRNFT